MRVGRLIVPLIGSTAAVLAACGPSNVATANAQGQVVGSDETAVTTAGENPTITQASAEARRYLPEFWRRFDAQEAGSSSFSVKADFPYDGGAEGMFVAVKEHAGGKIRGVLNSEPTQVKGLQPGSPVEISEDRVTDWTYVKNGKIYGNFITRAMVEQAPPELKAKILAALAPSPIEQGAQ